MQFQLIAFSVEFNFLVELVCEIHSFIHNPRSSSSSFFVIPEVAFFNMFNLTQFDIYSFKRTLYHILLVQSYTLYLIDISSDIIAEVYYYYYYYS